MGCTSAHLDLPNAFVLEIGKRSSPGTKACVWVCLHSPGLGHDLV